MMLLFLIVAGLFLAVSSAFHIKDPEKADQLLSQSRNVRWVGLSLIVIGLCGLIFKSKIIRLIAVLYLASGLWRVLFPMSSILFQKRSFPRWIHGVLLAIGALLIFAILFFPSLTTDIE